MIPGLATQEAKARRDLEAAVAEALRKVIQGTATQGDIEILAALLVKAALR